MKPKFRIITTADGLYLVQERVRVPFPIVEGEKKYKSHSWSNMFPYCSSIEEAEERVNKYRKIGEFKSIVVREYK